MQVDDLIKSHRKFRYNNIVLVWLQLPKRALISGLPSTGHGKLAKNNHQSERRDLKASKLTRLCNTPPVLHELYHYRPYFHEIIQ